MKTKKAVIVTGGKQYTLAEGDVLFIEKLNAEADTVIKYKPKKGEKKHIGHRQPYTKVEITKIAL